MLKTIHVTAKNYSLWQSFSSQYSLVQFRGRWNRNIKVNCYGKLLQQKVTGTMLFC